MDAGTGPKKTADDLERDTGIRWSILNNLEYHDPVTGHVVEPMHNLLLGEIIFNTPLISISTIHEKYSWAARIFQANLLVSNSKTS